MKKTEWKKLMICENGEAREIELLVAIDDPEPDEESNFTDVIVWGLRATGALAVIALGLAIYWGISK